MALTPHPNDVLFGRGVVINAHPGNRRLRAMVERRKQTYLAKNNKEKRKIATDIIEEIHNSQPPGRFLAEDPRASEGKRNGLANEVASRAVGSRVHRTVLERKWVIVEPQKAFEKVMHQLREKPRFPSGKETGGTFDDSQNGTQRKDPDNQVKTSAGTEFHENKNEVGVHATHQIGRPINLDNVGSINMELPESTNTNYKLDDISILGEKMDSSLWDDELFNSHLDLDDDGEMQSKPLPLKEWIEVSKQKIMFNDKKIATGKVSEEHIRSALFVALKLTECFIKAEKDANPIPLSSITAENVFVQSKALHIEDVWITGHMGGSSDTGGVLPRLFALGIVFSQLLSGDETLAFGGDVNKCDEFFDLPSMNSIDLSKSNGDQRKKNFRDPGYRDNHSRCISKLEFLLPHSLCALVKNLLGCSEGDFRSDDAFTSFKDVQMDLQLMLDDPSRFLDDIPTSPIPSLTICNKLYGREIEKEMVEDSYRKLACGTCIGIIVSGRAGVGKSKLAMHVRELTCKANGIFFDAKYEQNNYVKPLTAIGSVFNSLCDWLAQNSDPPQLISVCEALDGALGGQASLLAAVVPNLLKLMPSHSSLESSNSCIDVAMSLSFLFAELLRVISSLSKSISLLLDDIQWADSASLLLIQNLLSSIEGSKSVFFTLCYRDDEVADDIPFNNWLNTIAECSIAKIKLQNMNHGAVNNLVSDMLHLSPRITSPLSSALHLKTRGNPLFLRQLIESLRDQGHIYVNLRKRRWAWDQNEIMDMKIPDDAVDLLISEMHRLPADLQLSLKISSCMGSSVKYSVIEIISRDMAMDFKGLLRQISDRGFLEICVSSFRWIHDKVQQAAEELMPEQERLELHMRLGLSICSQILEHDPDNNELFFLAINQINRGGAGVISDPRKRLTIAALNLKAGRRAVAFSDFPAALKLFEHGASFLPSDSWATDYDMSVNLYDAAAETACITNNKNAVAFYSDQLITHAKCLDDKRNCLYIATKALFQANRLHDSMQSAFEVLQLFGEEIPQPMGSDKVNNEIRVMNEILRNTSDESILNAKETKNKKIVTLLKLYAELANIMRFIEPSLMGPVSLRMICLSLKHGLTSASPIGFALYGGVRAAMGNEHLTEACRLGRIALKLLENSNFSTHKSLVICAVYFSVLWMSDPIQSIAEAHLLGHRAGMQSGDVMWSMFNEQAAYQTNYVAGMDLSTVRVQLRSFVLKGQNFRSVTGRNIAILWYLQAVVLQDGKHRLNEECVDGIPGLREVDGAGKSETMFLLIKQNLHVQRAFFFRQFDDMTFETNNTSDVISEKKHPLRPALVMAIFFEGLVSFQLARKTSNETKKKWIGKGVSTLEKMRCWTNHCRWNCENKMLLLDAERMYLSGELEQAEKLYAMSIRSAHDHKFIHEEAVASEIAGDFFYEKMVPQKSLAFFKHSIECYKKWGALDVARRLEVCVESRFGLGIAQLSSMDEALAYIFTSSQQSSSKKRQDFTVQDFAAQDFAVLGL